MYRLAALDLDGTLVDSAPDLSHCLNSALDSVALPPPSLEQCRGWIGDGIETLLRRALTWAGDAPPDDALLARTLQAFDRCYRARLFVDSRLYPDVANTLEALRSSGLVVGCITNKREAYAIDLLDSAGIGDRLDFIYGGDTLPKRKPDPLPLTTAAQHFGISPAAAAMVGDSINDLRAAESAGFAFVYASYGYATDADGALAAQPARIRGFGELTNLLCGP
ncbi:MAG: phosphoglycolate phosphatase [Gammaproteobacteria bacterium]